MRAISLVLLSFFLVPTVIADILTLNNGDRLTGTIIRKEDSNLVFKTDYAGEIKIKWDQVTAVTTDKPVQLTLDNGTAIEKASLSPAQDKTAEIKAENINNDLEIKLSSVKYINPSDVVSGKGIKVSGRVNAGVNIASGNSDTESYNLDTEVVMRGKINRFTVGANLYRASDNSVDTEDKSSAWLKYDHFTSKKSYVYGNTSFARDKFKDQKLKSTIGLGYGIQFHESDERNFLIEGGLNYVNDDYFIAMDDDYAAGRWSLRYDQKFYKKRLQFFHNHEGLFDLDDTGNMNIYSQTGFRFPILSGMNASLQLNVDWDNQPVAGTASTDRKLLFNLGYSW